MTRKGFGPPVSTVVQTDEDGKDNTKSYTHKLARKSYLSLFDKNDYGPLYMDVFRYTTPKCPNDKKTVSEVNSFEHASF